VDASGLELPVPPAPPAVPPDAAARLEAITARVLKPPGLRARRAVLPVTQLQDFALCPRRYRFAHVAGLAERPRAFAWSSEADADDDAAGPSLDPRLRGVAAHRLLELTPLEAVGTPKLRAALEALALSEGLAPGAEVFDWVERFWSTPWGRALVKSRVHRELPFVLRLDDADGFSLFLRGQIDLLVETAAGAVQVVDYKTSVEPREGLAPYAFQLGCYALAAARFVKEGVKVETGIAFLREADPSPRFLEVPLGELERSLAGQARALVAAQLEGRWPGLELARCEGLGCGYVYRCHPPGNGL
jgi:CRISPR/Cas system-associated exonuclease Cas4 (RecB family)